MVGLAEIAQMLGVSRQRAAQLANDYSDFPPPLSDLASGRVWERSSVEAWQQAHHDRRPGRPKKVTRADPAAAQGDDQP